MEKIKPKILSGFMELLPGEQLRFEAMAEKLCSVYSLYGFTPLDTPLIESSEILLAKGGGETEKQIYRFTKGDNDLSIRFDLTVPLARFVAEHANELSFPFRRYQIGKVYRGERAQKGRFREFYQADIDIIGDGQLDIMNEAEIPSIIYRAFSSLGLNGFVIRINNRKILNGFFEIIGESDRAGDVMRIIDKLEKIGQDAVKDMLSEAGVPADRCNEIIGFISTPTAIVPEVLRKNQGRNNVFDQGVGELLTVLDSMRSFGVPEENFAVDLTIARGLDYYTGTVYETIVTAHPEIGSVCSGGRYDNLAEYYTDRHLPGVGISIGLTRLFYVLGEYGYFGNERVLSPADVLIIPMTDEIQPAIGLATELRNRGIRTQLYTEQKKFKAKIGYADKLGIPFVIFLGEDEIRNGKVSLKNLRTGGQSSLTTDETAEEIAKFTECSARSAIIKEPERQ